MMPVCLSYTKQQDAAIEVYNNAMLKVFQSISSYSGTGELGAWIRRIIVNACIDYLRKEARFEKKKGTFESTTLHYRQDIIGDLSADEILDLVRKLPDTHQLVFNLYVLEGFSHKEIAENLGLSTGTSKWYLNKARHMLIAELESIGISKLEV